MNRFVAAAIAVVALGVVVWHGTHHARVAPVVTPKPAPVVIVPVVPKPITAALPLPPAPIVVPIPKPAPIVHAKPKPKPKPKPRVVRRAPAAAPTAPVEPMGPITCFMVRRWVAGKTKAELEQLRVEHHVSDADIKKYAPCLK